MLFGTYCWAKFLRFVDFFCLGRGCTMTEIVYVQISQKYIRMYLQIHFILSATQYVGRVLH